MAEEWTADIVGGMHLNGIKALELAREIGWNPKYLSTVLNGHKTPANAEKKVRSALDALITSKKQSVCTDKEAKIRENRE